MANLIELALVLKSLNYRDMQDFSRYIENKPTFASMPECLLGFADLVEEREELLAQNVSGPLYDERCPC